MSVRIDRLWPDPVAELDDEQVLASYAFPEDRGWLRMNFVSSLDGAAARAGRSGGLGDAADRRVFALLRRPAHAVLVAAGTARLEGYAAMRLDAESAAWRAARGLAPHPVFVLVTRSLDLDPGSPIFGDAPVRPIVYTVGEAPASRRAALSAVADVVDAGEHEVDFARLRGDLAARGLTRVHSEGGPSLFGSMLAAGAVDELCLTLAPTLEAGRAPRIAGSPETAPTGTRLASVLRAEDELLLRYLRVSGGTESGNVQPSPAEVGAD